MVKSEADSDAAGKAGGPPDADAWRRTQGEDEVVLSLSELLRDENGEIVLFNDSGFRRVVLEADARPVERGEAEPHLTASGEDVTGWSYVGFDNGTRLYYPQDLELLVVPEQS
ncbi:MAG: hypothetical protein D6806_15315 [Deltaproteobacteria bacterium]|nr:MAG: hypothetical protein D6806_15315 [Deltaproteobacteria bacterium]